VVAVRCSFLVVRKGGSGVQFREASGELRQGQKQIPFGDDRKKGKSKSRGKSKSKDQGKGRARAEGKRERLRRGAQPFV